MFAFLRVGSNLQYLHRIKKDLDQLEGKIQKPTNKIIRNDRNQNK